MIGKFKYKLTLQVKNVVDDGAGGRKPATGSNPWKTITTIWGDIKTPPRTTVLEVQGAIVSDVIHTVHIWTRSDIKAGWQILCGNRIFSVLHCYPLDDRVLELKCREVVR